MHDPLLTCSNLKCLPPTSSSITTRTPLFITQHKHFSKGPQTLQLTCTWNRTGYWTRQKAGFTCLPRRCRHATPLPWSTEGGYTDRIVKLTLSIVKSFSGRSLTERIITCGARPFGAPPPDHLQVRSISACAESTYPPPTLHTAHQHRRDFAEPHPLSFSQLTVCELSSRQLVRRDS